MGAQALGQVGHRKRGGLEGAGRREGRREGFVGEAKEGPAEAPRVAAEGPCRARARHERASEAEGGGP